MTPQTICSGTAFTALTPSGTTGATFNWTASATAGTTSGFTASGSGTIAAQTLTNQGAVTYVVTPSIGSNPTCTGTAKNFVVTVNALPTVDDMTGQNICTGKAFTALTPSGTTGATFNWTASATAGTTTGFTASGSGTIAAQTLTNQGAVTYIVTPSIGSNPTCIGTAKNFVVTVNDIPTPSITGNSPICKGQKASLTAGGGTSFLWSDNTTTTALFESPALDVNTTYSVVVTDGNTCSASVTTEVVVNNCSIVIDINPATICEGKSTILLANVTTGQAPFKYEWSEGLPDNEGPHNVSPKVTTTYYLTVTDDLGVTNTQSAIITVNQRPATTANANTPCPNETINLTGGPNNMKTYEWTGPNSFTNNTQSPAINNAGTTHTGDYQLIVTDVNDCQDTANVTVTLNPIPTITGTTSAKIGTQTTLSGDPAGGTWSIDDQDIATIDPTTGVVTGGAIGQATVTYESLAGCTNTILITINSLTMNNPETHAYCKGDTWQVTGGGDNLDAWAWYKQGETPPASGSTDVAEMSKTIDDQTDVVWIFRGFAGTDFGDQTFTLTIKPTPKVNEIPVQNICSEETTTEVIISSDPIGATFTWTSLASDVNGEATSGTSTIPAQTLTTATTNAGSVTYSIIPTLDGCLGDAYDVTFTVNPIPTVNITNPDPVCEPNTIDLTNAAVTNGSTHINTLKYFTAADTLTSIANPSAIDKSDTYYIKGISSAGCESVSPVTVTINALPTVEATGKGRCGEGSVELTASATNAATINWYDAPTGGNLLGSGAPFTTASLSASTSFYAQADDGKCLSANRDEAIAQILTPPTIIATGNKRCDNGTVSLTATASAGTINWYDAPTGGNLLASGTTFNTPSLTSNTSFYAEADDNGCLSENRSEALATINPIPVITLNSLGDLCLNDPAKTLNEGAPIGGTYSWNGGSGNTFNPVATGTFVITYNYTDPTTGCSNSHSANLVVHPLPTLNLGNDITICNGQTTTLNAPNGNTFLWSDNNQSTQSINVSPKNNTTYTLTITDENGCSAMDNIIVKVSPIPTPNFWATPLSGCAPLNVTLVDNSSPASTYSYEWSLGDGAFATSPTVNHSYLMPGTYDLALKVTSPDNCAKDTVFIQYIKVYEVPKADFTFSPLTPSNFEPEVTFFDLSNGINIMEWNWNFNDPKSSDNSSSMQEPIHEFAQTGKFNVALTVKNEACSNTIIKPIIVKSVFTFYAPNAFTPNNDGVNDNFKTFAMGINENSFKLFIFTRWGELIYTANDINEPWNGTKNNNTKCPPDVYIWTAEFLDLDGKKYQETGKVALVE